MSDEQEDKGGESRPSGFFDNLESWEVSQDFLDATGVKKKLAVRVGRPPKQQFFRVHPDHSLVTLLVELDESKEVYIVAPDLRDFVATEFPESVKHARLVFAATKPGNYLVWPLKLQSPDGRSNDWYDSAIAAAQDAVQHWIRLVPNMTAGYYDVLQATASLAEPHWPDETWAETLHVAFKGRIIDKEDHAVLRELRGEV